MKKILGLIIGSFIGTAFAFAASNSDKFDLIPDLPEPLAAAQASSVTNTAVSTADTAVQSVGSEPNFLSVLLSLIFVILLIYATGIIYAKLNRAGLRTLKKHGDIDSSKVTVVSTTPLGSNKTLHVVELDGKRMLIGASANSIDLIKDLGNYPPMDIEEGEYSKIEIPNIRIPKIEIPKIEFPNIGFTKTFKNQIKEEQEQNDIKEENAVTENNIENNDDKFEISDIYEESPDGIIDKLFTPPPAENIDKKLTEEPETGVKHSIDPEEYALYKKYL